MRPSRILIGYPTESGEVAVALTQAAFRFYDDDAAYASATPSAAQDANITTPINEAHRIAVQLQAAGDPATGQYQLEYKKTTDGTWIPIS